MKKTLMPPMASFTLLAAACLTPVLNAQTPPRKIVIEAKRFSYNPGEITVKKGEPIVIVLKSEDVAHGFRIREFNVNMKVKAGGTAEAQFIPAQAGDFLAHCSVFCGSGHGSMILRVHVVD